MLLLPTFSEVLSSYLCYTHFERSLANQQTISQFYQSIYYRPTWKHTWNSTHHEVAFFPLYFPYWNYSNCIQYIEYFCYSLKLDNVILFIFTIKIMKLRENFFKWLFGLSWWVCVDAPEITMGLHENCFVGEHLNKNGNEIVDKNFHVSMSKGLIH